MKKLIAAGLMSCLMAGSAMAQSKQFFYKNHGQWEVVGITGDQSDNIPPNCAVKTYWKNGSFIFFVQDLIDFEIYLAVHNTEWNINVPKENINTIAVTFKSSQNVDIVLPYQIEFVSPKTIRLRELDFKNFVPLFANAKSFIVHMPGNISHLHAGLSGTKEAMGSMSLCIDAAEKLDILKLPPPKPPVQLKSGIEAELLQ